MREIPLSATSSLWAAASRNFSSSPVPSITPSRMVICVEQKDHATTVTLRWRVRQTAVVEWWPAAACNRCALWCRLNAEKVCDSRVPVVLSGEFQTLGAEKQKARRLKANFVKQSVHVKWNNINTEINVSCGIFDAVRVICGAGST